jgi:hypothetical protein
MIRLSEFKSEMAPGQTIAFEDDAEREPDLLIRSKDAYAFHFDRRREFRAQPGGWAQVLCRDPYLTFLGGANEIADHPIPMNEIVEVRLAPFTVRGKLGRVVRIIELPAPQGTPLQLVDEQATENPAQRVSARRYRIGVSFRGHRVAA